MQWPILKRNVTQLEQLAKPATGDGNTENLLQPYYDIQEYVSGTDTQLTFFGGVNQNRGHLTNMRQGGMIPKGKTFMPYFLTLDILGFGPGDYTRAADTYLLLHGNGATGIPYAVETYESKSYPDSGGVPLFVIGPAASMTGFTTRTSTEWAQTGAAPFFLGELPGGESVVTYQGGTSFAWDLTWADAVTLDGGNVYLMLTLWGTLFRNIQ